MTTLYIKNLDEKGRRELVTFYSEKIAQLEFQVLKMRRTLAKRQAQEQKWKENLTIYQNRKNEGEAALQVLSESNPYYHKIRLDVSRCEIKIMELEIRLQRFTLVQKSEKITKIMALEGSTAYYNALITHLENKIEAIPIVSSKSWLNSDKLFIDRPNYEVPVKDDYGIIKYLNTKKFGKTG
jgi:hypothetical protein